MSLSTACLFGSFFSACFLIPANTKHFEPCYGIPQQARLAGFDGIVPGGRYTFSNIDLAARVRGNQCSLPVADVNVPGTGLVATARGHEADSDTWCLAW